MEKSTPHYQLSMIKTLIEVGEVRATASAYNGARELGIHTLDEMCATLLKLMSKHFYKSMTTHADHRIWQDVYHVQIQNGQKVYLKLTVINDVLIVSFKEL